jgi:hypothetical protein
MAKKIIHHSSHGRKTGKFYYLDKKLNIVEMDRPKRRKKSR